MKCLSCAKLDLQKYPAHSRAGIGKCEHEQLAGTFVSIAHHRACPQFVAASGEVAQARINWYEKKEK